MADGPASASASPVQVPSDLTGLSNQELDDLVTAIQQRVLSLSEDLSEENVQEIEDLGDSFDAVADEIASRAEANKGLQNRANAVIDKVGNTAGSGEDMGSGAAPADYGSGMAAEEETLEVEGEVPETLDEPTTTEPAEDDETATAVAEPTTMEVAVPDSTTDDTTVETTEEEEVLVPDAVVTAVPAADGPTGASLVQQLAASRGSGSRSLAPIEREVLEAGFIASSEVRSVGMKPDEELDIETLSEAIAKKVWTMGNTTPAQDGERIFLAQAALDFPTDRMLTGDAEKNFELLYGGLVPETETLVASGGNCALAAPRYDIFRLAQPHSPVEGALPVIGAPRGAVRWVTPPDFRAARGGVGVTTCAEDAGGASGSGGVDKPCVHVTCPAAQEACVTAVSSCVEFGNLSYRTFPEQVAAFLLDLAVNFASVKEVLYLNAIDSVSTQVTASQVYGAVRSTMRNATLAAIGYRKRNGMDRDAVLDWYIPDWFLDFLKTDMVQDFALGMNYLGVTDAQVVSDIRGFAALNVVPYYDSATGLNQGMTTAQHAGALNAYPTAAYTYMHAPGTFARLDAGTLDVGLIRDSVLNRTNDLQIFSEQWVQVIMLGIEAIRLEFTSICPTGTGPVGVTALTC